MLASVPYLPAVCSPRCVRYAPASNLILKAGRRAIMSTVAADKCLWSLMLPSPLHGLCPMKAAPMPTPT
jgi:hypothetical protein